MAVKKLPHANAFSIGADLWILPDLPRSSWAQTVDWYVNFQLSKARLHTPAKFSPELQDLVDRHSSEVFRIEVHPKAPLFLATEKLLPNRETVVLPYEESLETWLDKAVAVWKRLNSPPLRVFLPDETASSEFVKLWEDGVGTDAEATFVSDR